MKSNSKIMIVASILLLASLPGCSLNNGSATKLIEKSNTVQSAESARPLPTVPKIDPVREAESEKFFEQGLKLYEQSDYPKAVVAFEQAIAANPANYKVYTAKGIALCFEGEYQSGMAQIQKTLDMNPGYIPAFYDMAMAYKLQNNYDQSLYWFEKTIQGDPKNTWSYYGIATIHADRGNTQESLKYLRRAIELDATVKSVAQQQSHFDQMRNIPEFQALCASSTTD